MCRLTLWRLLEEPSALARVAWHAVPTTCEFFASRHAPLHAQLLPHARAPTCRFAPVPKPSAKEMSGLMVTESASRSIALTAILKKVLKKSLKACARGGTGGARGEGHGGGGRFEAGG